MPFIFSWPKKKVKDKKVKTAGQLQQLKSYHTEIKFYADHWVDKSCFEQQDPAPGWYLLAICASSSSAVIQKVIILPKSK